MSGTNEYTKEMRQWMRRVDKRLVHLERRRAVPTDAANVYAAQRDVEFVNGEASVDMPPGVPIRAIPFVSFSDRGVPIGARQDGASTQVTAPIPDGTYAVYFLFVVP